MLCQLNLLLNLIVLYSKRAESKKHKSEPTPEQTDFSSEDSIFQLLSVQQQHQPTLEQVSKLTKPTLYDGKAHSPTTFANYVPVPNVFSDDETEVEQKPTSHVPVDWGLKTKLRILSNTPVPGNCLKTSQEASGITRFVLNHIKLF